MRKNGNMVPLNPQPDLDSLVILQVVSYHSKLKKRSKLLEKGKLVSKFSEP
jgi:hypothetical protein